MTTIKPVLLIMRTTVRPILSKASTLNRRGHLTESRPVPGSAVNWPRPNAEDVTIQGKIDSFPEEETIFIPV
jgi:hypothetical protein